MQYLSLCLECLCVWPGDAFYDDLDDSEAACVFETCADNSSFSDYDWASESEGFTPMECPEDQTALIVGLTVGSVLLCCCCVAVGVYFYFRNQKQKEAVKEVQGADPVDDADDGVTGSGGTR